MTQLPFSIDIDTPIHTHPHRDQSGYDGGPGRGQSGTCPHLEHGRRHAGEDVADEVGAALVLALGRGAGAWGKGRHQEMGGLRAQRGAEGHVGV
jgi:hypothetical protein